VGITYCQRISKSKQVTPEGQANQVLRDWQALGSNRELTCSRWFAGKTELSKPAVRARSSPVLYASGIPMSRGW